jgi:hypothetical protein
MEEPSDAEKPPSGKLLQSLRWLASTQVLVTLPTLVISFALAYFSFVQADATRKMQRSETWPYVSYGTSNVSPEGKTEISLNLSNDGVGPAQLEELEFIYAGKAMTSPREFIRDCCAGTRPAAFASSPVDGVLRPGETRNFIRMPKTEHNADVWNRLESERWKVVVRSCYCSIFEDCWVFDSQKKRPEPVKACPADWTRFEELPNPNQKRG